MYSKMIVQILEIERVIKRVILQDKFKSWKMNVMCDSLLEVRLMNESLLIPSSSLLEASRRPLSTYLSLVSNKLSCWQSKAAAGLEWRMSSPALL